MLIIYPPVAKESANMLATFLKIPAVPSVDADALMKGTEVFNYGCTIRNKKLQYVVNNPVNVRKSVDKLTTLSYLKAFDIPTVDFVVDKDLLKNLKWNTICVRKTLVGKENEGLEYVSKGEKIPDAPLYTKYYDHKYEFRIVVYKGKVVGRYLKKRTKQQTWDFVSVDPAGFGDIDYACIKALKVLGLDYAGVDVLSNGETKFKLLEVNSAPVITDEVMKEIKNA